MFHFEVEWKKTFVVETWLLYFQNLLLRPEVKILCVERKAGQLGEIVVPEVETRVLIAHSKTQASSIALHLEHC